MNANEALVYRRDSILAIAIASVPQTGNLLDNAAQVVKILNDHGWDVVEVPR